MKEYNYMAAVYDPLLHFALKPIRKRAAEIVKRLDSGSIIDICCGTGNQLKYLRKEGINEVVGIDLSDAMLEQASKGGTRVACSKQDATSMDFSPNSFDMGMISFALHEKSPENAEKIVREARRIIKPGGHLMIVDYIFDNRTQPLGKTMISFVEFFAGREHFRNFKKYKAYGGLPALEDGLHLMEEHAFHRGGTRLRLYKLIN